MTSKSMKIQVPGLVRDYLMPYADLFEQVVIPNAKKISLAKMNRSNVNKLKKEIKAYQGRSGIRQHYFLVYFGLMLCCLYCEKAGLEVSDSKRKLEELNIISRARSLISLAYQDKVYDLIPFML